MTVKNSTTYAQNKASISAHQLAKTIADLSLTKKAEDVTILNLQGLTSITDYFVIASGASDVQVKAIVDTIQDELEPEFTPWYTEGYENLRWVLLDFVDVVVHVFQKPVREYYDLERLWADADVETVQEEDLEE